MRALHGRSVFRVGDEEYGWEEVVLASAASGDWAAVVADARRGVACTARLEREGGTIAAAQLEPRASAFRYERDLVAAADLHAWLERWGLAVADWLAWLRRGILRERWAGELEAMIARHPPDAVDVARAVPAEAVCSGRLVRFARRLAAQAAAADRLRESRPDAADRTSDVGDVADASIPADAASALDGVSPERLRLAARRVARLGAAMETIRHALLTDEALADAVAARRLDWTHVEYSTLVLPSEAAAREAVLCVRDDGEPLSEVGAAAGVPLRRQVAFLESHQEPLRGMLLGAMPGELLGPIRGDGLFTLLQVHAKRLPSVDDPTVRRRAEEDLVGRVLQVEADRRVRWLAAP